MGDRNDGEGAQPAPLQELRADLLWGDVGPRRLDHPAEASAPVEHPRVVEVAGVPGSEVALQREVFLVGALIVADNAGDALDRELCERDGGDRYAGSP